MMNNQSARDGCAESDHPVVVINIDRTALRRLAANDPPVARVEGPAPVNPGVRRREWLLCGASLALSVTVYAAMLGWVFAAGLMALLLAHEAGHYLAARVRGVRVRLPVFVPLFGAFIHMEPPDDAEQEACVALAGPLLGTVAAIACFQIGALNHSSVMVTIAATGLYINLLNLIPIVPLDGGRMMAAVSPAIWGLGMAILAGVWLIPGSPLYHRWMVLPIAVMAALEIGWTLKNKVRRESDYYATPGRVRAFYSIVWLGLATLLAVLLTIPIHAHFQ